MGPTIGYYESAFDNDLQSSNCEYRLGVLLAKRVKAGFPGHRPMLPAVLRYSSQSDRGSTIVGDEDFASQDLRTASALMVALVV
jgi:hypothetical protein